MSAVLSYRRRVGYRQLIGLISGNIKPPNRKRPLTRMVTNIKQEIQAAC